MSLHIAGLGLSLPRHALTQSDAAEILLSFLHPDGGRPRTVRALYGRSGIERRHSVLLNASDGPLAERQSFYPPARGPDDAGPPTDARMRAFEEHAPGLALSAAQAALDDASTDAGAITHLVTVSCTGFFAPGLDASLVHRLGLSPSVERTHVGFMGCHGALNGLRVATSFAGADPGARVLLCAVELCTLHLGYSWDPQTVVANALFADGAAAAVGVGASHGAASTGWRVAATGTFLLPDSADAMSWKVGDHGFRMTLSAAVPDLSQRHVGEWLQGWLGAQGLTIPEVRSWAVHPGGPRVLTAFGKTAGLDSGAFAASRAVLADHGNMSSATLLFILQELRSSGAETPLVAMAFGPGLVVEAALLL